jgi:hypothetical protein
VSTIVNTVSRARSGTAMAAPFTAPATPFNAEVTAGRNIALAQLDFDDVKRVKNRFDVKVNDVVLALCAGALREFLRDRGELPDKPLVAVVPMSVHDTSDRPGRNQVSGMFCNLQTHIGDPGERLQAIAKANSRAKEHSRAIAPSLVLDVTQVITRAMFGFVFGRGCSHPAASYRDPQRDHLECGGPAEQAVLLGRRNQSAVSARPDLSWIGTDHHGDVAARQAQRRHHLVPTTGGRPVGPGRPLRVRTKRTAWQSKSIVRSGGGRANVQTGWWATGSRPSPRSSATPPTSRAVRARRSGRVGRSPPTMSVAATLSSPESPCRR